MSPTCKFCPRVDFGVIDVWITFRTIGVVQDGGITPRWCNAFLDDVVSAIVVVPVLFIFWSVRDAKFNLSHVLRYTNLEYKRIIHYRNGGWGGTGHVGTFDVRKGGPIVHCISNDDLLLEANISNFDSS